ncbi:UBA/TS-N domain protein [Ancylostoma caninum]|uniref:UBA/TS-N domain protein n=1 Tax=Ancylostoma caninum TaxID=29170 RepID=A0A368H4C7_ANCCA|nr:UBA/TS-N domain protein [Ancylostoma caninum]
MDIMLIVRKGNSTGQQCSQGGQAGDQQEDSVASDASVKFRPSSDPANEGPLTEGVLSDQATVQLLIWLEMMDLFVQTLSKNPQDVQRLLEQNNTAARCPEGIQQIHAQLPRLVDITRRPEFTSALKKPRVLSAIRSIQREMDTIRREAPYLVDVLRGAGATDEHQGEAGPAHASTSSPSTGQQVPQTSPSGDTSESVDAELLHQLYEEELGKLIRMGFSNKAKNLEALRASNGNMDVAVELLLNASQS